MHALVFHCRSGYESDLATEIQTVAASHGVTGFCRAKTDRAVVSFQPHESEQAAELADRMDVADLIFARQGFLSPGRVDDLPARDRASPLARAIAALGRPVSGIFVERPDTEAGKTLSALCRQFQSPMEHALQEAGIFERGAEHRAHVLFESGRTAWPGVAAIARTAPWPMGVLRLKFPRRAPSRSALKLEEALLTLLTADEQHALLREGMRAVDLGAAPGGWTYQLLRRGMWVTAVDNGALDPSLAGDDMVEHLREDGFRFRPPAPVDWMVCDMIEQPLRVAELVARWVAEGWCRATVFNLKLPMKRRWQEVARCRETIAGIVAESGGRAQLRLKHLYHDRDEISGFLYKD